MSTERPKCHCFANGEEKGDRIVHGVAAYMTMAFALASEEAGVCGDAAVYTVGTLLAGLAVVACCMRDGTESSELSSVRTAATVIDNIAAQAKEHIAAVLARAEGGSDARH